LYKNRKETAIYKRRNNTENNTQTIQKHRIQKRKTKNKQKKNIKNISRVFRK